MLEHVRHGGTSATGHPRTRSVSVHAGFECAVLSYCEIRPTNRQRKVVHRVGDIAYLEASLMDTSGATIATATALFVLSRSVKRCLPSERSLRHQIQDGQRVTFQPSSFARRHTWDCSMECLAESSVPAWCRSSTASSRSTAAFRASSTNSKRTDSARRSSHGWERGPMILSRLPTFIGSLVPTCCSSCRRDPGCRSRSCPRNWRRCCRKRSIV